MANVDPFALLLNQLELESFVRREFARVRADWDSGDDRILYESIPGASAIAGGRDGELPLFEAAFVRALQRFRDQKRVRRGVGDVFR